jgi:hypothetical protein
MLAYLKLDFRVKLWLIYKDYTWSVVFLTRDSNTEINVRMQAWKFFGFLLCDTSNQAQQTVCVAAVSIFNLVYCIQNLWL